jgi:hypothetical protein
MDLDQNFAFQPTTPIQQTPSPTTGPPPPPPPPATPDPATQPSPNPILGPLAGLLGSWRGTGFNLIWRPAQGEGSDHFLELNVTTEHLAVRTIPGDIPNRGLLQPDLIMAGLHYLQQISDSNFSPPSGLHMEPGVWLAVPATTNPLAPASIARLACVPHGTTVLAQGLLTTFTGPPPIPSVSSTPFVIGDPLALQTFAEQTIANASAFRTGFPGATGITQSMVDDPNSVLEVDPNTVTTVVLSVSSDPTAPIVGGGDVSTAFLQGGASGPNALVARTDATFWLQTRSGETEPGLLQYTQTVLLNFNGISWPHISVATLSRVLPAVAGSPSIAALSD